MAGKRHLLSRIFKIGLILIVAAMMLSIAFFISPAFRDRILRKTVDDKLAEISGDVKVNGPAETADGPDPAPPDFLSDADRGVMVLDERAFNRYIETHYGRDIPPEITDWAAELHDDTGTLYLIVDLNEFMGSIEEETSQVIADMVKEGIGFVIEGKLSGQGGIGLFKIEKVNLGMIPLPLGLISKIVKQEVIKQGETPLEDVLSLPFELPDGFQSASIQDGRVILTK